jgi:hypothetical protein
VIQFFGLDMDHAAARAAVLGKDLKIWARASTSVFNAVEDPGTGVYEVPVAEWVRAGCHVLQEAYMALPWKARKAWGAGLSGPAGWVALDFDYEPLSPLRITAETAPEADIAAWLSKNPRLARRISVILSPKDYFRFAVSGGLASDVTLASRSGLLQEGTSQWSEEAIESRGLDMAWMPPVFDGPVTTGTLSEEGIRRSGLPGGFWLVAGSHSDEAALVASGDLRDGALRVLDLGEGRSLLAADAGGAGSTPAGWRAVRSPIPKRDLLEREVERGADDPLEGFEPYRSELRSAGLGVPGIERVSAAPEDGAAALAAMASGLAKDWDHYYRSREAPAGGGEKR